MKRIVRPVTKGRARVPVVMQMEALECGAASLTMILAYYNKWIPLELVRIDCGVSRDGSNAVNIMKAAENYGLEASGYRSEPEQLREHGVFPCIIHWNFNHFVVLCGFKGKYAYLNDPARGSIRVTMEEFDRSFTGIYLEFQPGAGFEPSGRQKSMLGYIHSRLSGETAALAFVALTTMIALFFEILNPAFSRFFMDQLLSEKNRELLMPFTLVLIVAGFLQILVIALNSIYRLKISSKMDASGSSSFFWKLMRMPIEFYEQRLTGDIMMRQTANAGIVDAMIGTVIPLALNLVMLLLYLIVMLRYSVVLTLVGVLTGVLDLLIMQMITVKRVNAIRVQKRDAGKQTSTAMSGIRMIETIKSCGAENGFFERWAGYQASVNAQTVEYEKLNHKLGAVPSFLASLANASVLIIGVWMALQGQFTVGMILTFQGFMGSFMKPAADLIAARQTIQELRTDMERIEDVMEYPAEPRFKHSPLDEEPGCAKLSGEITLNQVTFGYSRLDKPLLENFSLHIKPGSCIAVVGESGCGKSTLSKLISALYLPWKGEILFDGKPISKIDHSVFSNSVAVVDQDIILFADTIENNIKMWNDSIEDYEMILAARDAQIYDDILQREGGFEGQLSEEGRDLSGGQKQRLEIARALAQEPTILIMDEATSALDAETEYEVIQAVKARGITCIMIAHRLSAIRFCDQILVLDHGKVVEQGTHDELLRKGGAYAELIASD